MGPLGWLSLVLHAHLPWVRHPEHDDFLEEDWLFEAITETYVPLVRMLDRLAAEGVAFGLTMSVTPPLAEMLADPLLQRRYTRHLGKLLELAEKQAVALADGPFGPAAADAAETLRETWILYVERWNCQLLPRLAAHARAGRLQLLTCTTTHGLLPLMATDEARWAQIEGACRTHARHFGARPDGIWLAECAWSPGLDKMLAAAGLRMFVGETHAVEASVPPAHLGTARPIVAPAGVACFGRDVACSRQVWSAETGYPGDPVYREFYKDLGWELPLDQVGPYLHADGVRRGVGLKLHRVTGKVPLDQKQPYDPAAARETVARHAAHFVAARRTQAQALRAELGVAPHLTAPYDAELFGHWWFEGPRFIEGVLRGCAEQPDIVRTTTLRAYLDAEPVHQQAVPARSTWGAGGAFEVWLNDGNAWIYRHLHRAEERMIELARRAPGAQALERRAITQAGRELLLAQSSDWAFIITHDTTVEYAVKRTHDHIGRFTRLYEQVLGGTIDPAALAELESRDNAFPDLDPLLWHPDHVPARGGGAVVTVRA